MNYQVLNITPAEGRVAVRDPRVSDRLEMLRDLVAHGIWYHYKRGFLNEYHVQLARGTWPKTLREYVTGSRKVTPEGIPLSVETLRSATTEMKILIDDLARLRASAIGPPRP